MIAMRPQESQEVVIERIRWPGEEAIDSPSRRGQVRTTGGGGPGETGSTAGEPNGLLLRGQVLIGESLVQGMETAFRRYFPPIKYRSADDGRSLRGFVETLMYADDGLANFAEGREEEMSRLLGALRALDTFRAESGHYSWTDFVALLAQELGDARGAVYEQGRGFVVPGEDYGKSLLETTAPFFEQAMRAIENSGGPAPVGGSREDLMQRLRELNPGDYEHSPFTPRTRKRPAPPDDDCDGDGDGNVASSQFGATPGMHKTMDLDGQVVGADLAAMTAPEEGREQSSSAAAGVEKEDVLSLKDIEIAAIEEQLAALKMAASQSASTASSPPELQQQQQQTPVPTRRQTSRWQSAQQVSDGVERRIAMKASQPSPAFPAPATQAVEDDYLRKGPLSAGQEREVDRAFYDGPEMEVLVKAFNTDITRRDLRCLLPETWLNDEVVNMYMQLLQVRDNELCKANPNRRPSHFFNSFFLTKLRGYDSCGYNYRGVRRWTRKVKIFEMDKVFVPVNVSNTHWCMAVIYVQEKRINYYDSLGASGKGVTESLLMWLEDEDEDKNGDNATFEPDHWTLVGTDKATTPQQANGSDCGAFAVSFASYISDNLPFDFRQADITQMRRRMMWAVVPEAAVNRLIRALSSAENSLLEGGGDSATPPLQGDGNSAAPSSFGSTGSCAGDGEAEDGDGGDGGEAVGGGGGGVALDQLRHLDPPNLFRSRVGSASATAGAGAGAGAAIPSAGIPYANVFAGVAAAAAAATIFVIRSPQIASPVGSPRHQATAAASAGASRVRILHVWLLAMHVTACFHMLAGMIEYMPQPVTELSCGVARRVAILSVVWYDSFLVLFLLAKTSVTNGNRTLAGWETCITWWSRFYAYIFLPGTSLWLVAVVPIVANEEGTECLTGSKTESEAGDVSDTFGYASSNIMLVIQFVLLLAMFIKPMLLPQSSSQSGGALYRRVVNRNILCTVCIVSSYIITTLVVILAFLSSSPKAAIINNAAPSVNMVLTLFLTEIALPLGISSCYKSIIASRTPTGGAQQPNSTFARAKTQGTGLSAAASTATRNQPGGAVVVPVEGNEN
eukprot:g10891.t1